MAYPQAHVRRKRRSRYRALQLPGSLPVRLPARRPVWLSGRRIAAALAAIVLLPIVVYGVRVVGGLSKITGSNPGSVLGCLVHIKCDSVLATTTDRINIALYGYPGGHGGDGYLTDSIMIVSIQPRVGQPPQIAQISLPRDWFVPIDTGGKTYDGRINEAYEDGLGTGPQPSTLYKGDSLGGGKLADTTLGTILGLKIDHFIGVDFHAFLSAVDAVGGVDVDVPDSFTDNQYPHGDCDSGDCAVMTVHFDKGMQHMDGTRALIFARSRHAYDNPSEASNFARNRRQQLILTALKQKVLSVGGIGKLPDLLNALGDNVRTDLGIADVEALYNMVKGVDNRSIEHISVDDSNFLYECGYPRNCPAAYEYAHDASYQSLQRYLRNVFVDPATLAEHAPVRIEDATGSGAASSRWTTLFKNVGLSTNDAGGVSSSATTHVIDDSGGRFAKTAHWLANYFGVSVETPPSSSGATAAASGDAAAPTGDVRLVLGRDSEQAWSGNGQGYPGNQAGNANGVTSTSAQRGAPASSTSSSPPRTPAPAPKPPPSPTPTPPPICVPPLCKPHP